MPTVGGGGIKNKKNNRSANCCAACADKHLLNYGELAARADDALAVIITALHVMQTRYSEENSVRLSVCPSVTRVIPDKTEKRSVQIFIPYEKTFILVF